MLIKANRRIPVALAEEIADGSLSLTMNTDLNMHSHLCAIPDAELTKILNEALDSLIVKFDELKNEYDKRRCAE